MTVRIAETRDVDAIAALEAVCFPQDPWPPGYIAEAVAGTLYGVVVHVAVEDDAVIGHAITSVVFDVAELQRIAVSPQQRRRGIAGRLLDAVRAEAGRQQAERLLLEVRDTNAGALAFYERAGFVEIDRRPRYYRDGATAIILQVALGQGR